MRYNKPAMKKLKFYLDTSVLNFALTDKPELALQKKATVDLLDEIRQSKYEGCISDQVFIEIERASPPEIEALKNLINTLDLEVLTINKETESLADKYVSEGLIPLKYREDALHIAIATINEADLIVSWNFEHIVKMKTKHGVIAVNTLLGYKAVEIISPQEVG